MNDKLHRNVMIFGGLVIFVIILIIIWYFFYAKPVLAPNLSTPKDPLATQTLPKQFQFITQKKLKTPVTKNAWGKGDTDSSTSVTSVSDQPLVEVWGKPSTGHSFVMYSFLKEITATSSNGTSTISVKKTVTSTSSMLMFVDRISGFIYGYVFDTGRVFQISNTTISGVYDAYIYANGTRVLFRYEDKKKHKVVSVVASVPQVLPTGGALPLINMAYLPVELTSVAVNKKGTRVSYLVEGEKGSSVYNLTTKGPSLFSSSPFREWNLSYGGDTLYATTKPSAYIEGSTFSLPSFMFLTGEKTGLTSNPSEGGTLLNSMWSSSGLVTFISRPSGNKNVTVNTLSSKCAWGQKEFLVCAVPNTLPRTEEGLPDDWLQGTISFEDSLFVVDPNDGQAYPLFSFEEQEIPFDVTHLVLSEDNFYISFLRKQDSSLWLLNSSIVPKE